MKATYEPKTDTFVLELKQGKVFESDEDKPGVILDYDAEGNLLGLEILDASKRMEDARSMQFQLAG